MAVVNSEIRFAPQLTAWFTANPTKVLQDGEIVYCSDGANIGKYVIGDNSTELQSLVFYGGISASGLTVGTTTITGGTDTRVLYNNAGVVGEYAVTGTGTTAVLSVSPVFGTDITTPLVIGGTGVNSVIQYKGTSGVGTSTVAAHQFLVGNNGATTAASIYNSGNVNIGNKTNTSQRLVRIGQDSAWLDVGSWPSTTGLWGVWGNQPTPTDSNYSLGGSSNTTILQGTSFLSFRINSTTIVTIDSTTLTVTNAVNFAFNATTGTKLGTATNEKLSFWNATPIVQPTTAVAAATIVNGAGTNALQDDTYDGYTMAQVVKALRNTGLLA